MKYRWAALESGFLGISRPHALGQFVVCCAVLSGFGFRDPLLSRRFASVSRRFRQGPFDSGAQGRLSSLPLFGDQFCPEFRAARSQKA